MEPSCLPPPVLLLGQILGCLDSMTWCVWPPWNSRTILDQYKTNIMIPDAKCLCPNGRYIPSFWPIWLDVRFSLHLYEITPVKLLRRMLQINTPKGVGSVHCKDCRLQSIPNQCNYIYGIWKVGQHVANICTKTFKPHSGPGRFISPICPSMGLLDVVTHPDNHCWASLNALHGSPSQPGPSILGAPDSQRFDVWVAMLVQNDSN